MHTPAHKSPRQSMKLRRDHKSDRNRFVLCSLNFPLIVHSHFIFFFFFFNVRTIDEISIRDIKNNFSTRAFILQEKSFKSLIFIFASINNFRRNGHFVHFGSFGVNYHLINYIYIYIYIFSFNYVSQSFSPFSNQFQYTYLYIHYERRSFIWKQTIVLSRVRKNNFSFQMTEL